MGLKKALTSNREAVDLSDVQPIPLRNVAPGTVPGDAVPYEQAVKVNSDGSTLEADLAFTGDNTHTGTETFSNATGVTTAVITPATSGAGTALKVPAGVVTTTPFAPTLSGGTYGLSKADGLAVTLPALATAGIGTKLKFHILTSCTSVGYVISTGEAGDVMTGSLWATIANPDAANDMELNIADGTENTLTLGATTACGLAGGWVEFTAISATQWAVSGVVLGSGTVASNLFSTV